MTSRVETERFARVVAARCRRWVTDERARDLGEALEDPASFGSRVEQAAEAVVLGYRCPREALEADPEDVDRYILARLPFGVDADAVPGLVAVILKGN